MGVHDCLRALARALMLAHWYWQAVATKTGSTVTLGAGQLAVLAALNYTGTPGAVDGRTQAQKDLDAVQAAIRTIDSWWCGSAVQHRQPAAVAVSVEPN
jgi:hypothetical protein